MSLEIYFGLKAGVVGTYIRGMTNPQVSTMQKICNHFEICLDDFINKDLRNKEGLSSRNHKQDALMGMLVNPLKGSMENSLFYNLIHDYRRMLDDKDKIIEMLEAKIERLHEDNLNSNTAYK